jgi:glycosyltransferase involved in cell wall biosynthesis
MPVTENQPGKSTIRSAVMPKILYVQYPNPAAYPPLVHSAGLLAEAGCSVKMIGCATLNSEAMRIDPQSGVSVNLLRYNPPGVKQKIQYLWFGLTVLKEVLGWRPSWVYASDLFSCPIALSLCCVPGLRIIYHEHDHPGFNLGLLPRLFMRARKLLSARAAMVILPSASRAVDFNEETGRQGICVWNCPRRSEASSRRGRNEFIMIYYHGTLNSSRLPTSFLEAVASLGPNVRLRIAGYETIGSIGYCDLLRQRARELGIDDRFEIIGPCPRRDDVIRLCRDADVGIACMPIGTNDPNFKTMAGASNKPFDYMACGLALLVSDIPEWSEMFVQPGYGRSCNPADPASIAIALRWFCENRERTREMGELGRQRILSDWNYENQFAPVLDAIIGKG